MLLLRDDDGLGACTALADALPVAGPAAGGGDHLPGERHHGVILAAPAREGVCRATVTTEPCSASLFYLFIGSASKRPPPRQPPRHAGHPANPFKAPAPQATPTRAGCRSTVPDMNQAALGRRGCRSETRRGRCESTGATPAEGPT
eukprot:scaffold31_cov312-Prasinococcus_capsulatus_cf.AAC.7